MKDDDFFKMGYIDYDGDGDVDLYDVMIDEDDTDDIRGLLYPSYDDDEDEEDDW